MIPELEDLKEHEETHKLPGTNNYVCHQCDKSFTKKAILKQHLRVS